MIDTPSSPLIPADDERSVRPNFITKLIDGEIAAGLHSEIVTRFPPDPNGFLHIGHAMAVCLNFGVARDYGGYVNLRFDDTNPTTADPVCVEAIQEDIRWLGYSWKNVLFASDYFDELYAMAVRLIEVGKAYVDSLSEEEIREYRGTVTEPGRESPYRSRSAAESLELFDRMRRGEFAEGAHVLRAKIDMASPNMIMRDPILYRILHEPHYRTGDRWHVYPMYDFAHPLSDAIEGVTHSLCSLEFENNREIYDWLVDELFEPPRPHQYEFARLNFEHAVMSKRLLTPLAKSGLVEGWDDPRMPTLAALRRRGVTPAAIREFVDRLGVTKTNSVADLGLLEYTIRDDLNRHAPRVLAVTRPLRAVLSNYPGGKVERLAAPYWPPDVPNRGSRELPFARELYLERDDFSEDPPPGWRRLSPGAEVRLRHAYLIRCDEVVRDEEGELLELRCSYDPDSLGVNPPGRRIAGAIHWLAAPSALPAEFRLYDRLFRVPSPDPPLGGDASRESLTVCHGFVEPSVAHDSAETRYQFERLDYFWRDPKSSAPVGLVFNRIITLRSSWNAGGEVRRDDPTKSGGAQASPPGEAPDPVAALTAEQRASFERYSALELSRNEAALLAGNSDLANFFEEALAHQGSPASLANWVVNELLRVAKVIPLSELPFGPAEFARLVALVDDNALSSRAAKEVLKGMLAGEGDPDAIVAARGFTQVSDASALESVITRVLEANPEKVEVFRQGKTGLLGFFMGQVMRETGGKANPQLTRGILEAKLRRPATPGDR